MTRVNQTCPECGGRLSYEWITEVVPPLPKSAECEACDFTWEGKAAERYGDSD